MAPPLHGKGQPPQKIALLSMDLCADQWIMEKGIKEAVLTPLSQRPDLSLHASKSSAYAKHDGRIRSIIAHNPQKILSTYPLNPFVKEMLEKSGIHILVHQSPSTIADVHAQSIRIDGAFMRPHSPLPRPQDTPFPIKFNAVVVMMGGLSPGKNTLMDNILSKTGFHNIAPHKGHRYLSRPQLLKYAPDVIICITSAPQATPHGVMHCPQMNTAQHQPLTCSLPQKAVLCPTVESLKVIRKHLEACHTKAIQKFSS